MGCRGLNSARAGQVGADDSRTEKEPHGDKGQTMSTVGAAGRTVKKVGVFIVGFAVVAAGIALLALPGPGVLVIIVGLLILATEFDWAQRGLDVVVERAAGATSKLQDSANGRRALAASGVLMIGAGITLSIVSPSWIVAGVSLGFAGAIGLCTLHPAIQDWIDDKALTGTNDTDDVAA